MTEYWKCPTCKTEIPKSELTYTADEIERAYGIGWNKISHILKLKNKNQIITRKMFMELMITRGYVYSNQNFYRFR